MSSLISKIGRLRNDLSRPPLRKYGAAKGLSVAESATWAPWFPGGNMDENLLRVYGQSATVYQTIFTIATAVAGVDWGLYRRPKADGRVRYTTGDLGSDQRTEVLQHAASEVMACPNPFWTRFRLMEMTQTYCELTGKGYVLVTRDERSPLPVNLWVIRPDRLIPWPAQLPQYQWGWVYVSPDGMEKIPLRNDEVLFMHTPNPLDPYSGLGPTQAALIDIETSRYSGEYNRNFFNDGAMPGGILQVSNRLDDDEADALSDQWREQHRGVARAHRVALLEADSASWIGPSNAKDGDFVELRKQADTATRTAWGMHGSMLGLSEDINRSNAASAKEVFGTWKTEPRLKRWRELWNTQFLPMFGEPVVTEFDYASPVKEDRDQANEELLTKSKAAQALVAAGYAPNGPKGVLKTVGLPDMDVAERATQEPALPPGWVAGAAAPSEDDVHARLVKVLGNGHLKVGSR